MGTSADTTSQEEVTSLADDSSPTCPEEILRLFVTIALDQLNYPFVENLPTSHKDNWRAIIFYLRSIEDRLELINAEQHH